MFGPESIIQSSYHLTGTLLFKGAIIATVCHPLLSPFSHFVNFLGCKIEIISFKNMWYILDKVVALWALIHLTPIYIISF